MALNDRCANKTLCANSGFAFKSLVVDLFVLIVGGNVSGKNCGKYARKHHLMLWCVYIFIILHGCNILQRTSPSERPQFSWYSSRVNESIVATQKNSANYDADIRVHASRFRTDKYV